MGHSAPRRPVRVCHVIPSLGAGGAERQLVDLVTTPQAGSVQHRVVHLGPPDTLRGELLDAGVSVECLKAPGSQPWLTGLPKLVSTLRRRSPDVVHSWLFEADVAVRLAAPLSRRPPVVTSLQCDVYDERVVQAAGWPPRSVAARRALERLSLKITRTEFVACSRHVLESTRASLGVPHERLRVIPNAIDLDAVANGAGGPQIRASLGIAEATPVIITVGRLDPGKGHLELIAAFAELPTGAAQPQLVILGEGSSRPVLEQETQRLGLDGRVHLPGSHPNVGDWLAVADVFAFPSRFEGFGIALVEAMAAGLPCVVTDVGALADIVEDEVSGLVVPLGDQNALTTALERLLTDRDLRGRLASCGRRAVRELYDIKVTSPAWTDLYRALALRTAAGRRSLAPTGMPSESK